MESTCLLMHRFDPRCFEGESDLRLMCKAIAHEL